MGVAAGEHGAARRRLANIVGRASWYEHSMGIALGFPWQHTKKLSVELQKLANQATLSSDFPNQGLPTT